MNVIIAIIIAAILGGCSISTTVSSVPAWTSGGPVVMTLSSAPPSFYAPTVIKDGNGFTMWVTNGDRIARYQSTNGTTWTGGDIVLSAIAKTWEDDGGSFLGYKTGL